MKTILAVLILGAMSANAGDWRDRQDIQDASARIAAAIQFESQQRQYEAWDIERQIERIERQRQREFQQEKQRQYWESLEE